MTPRRRILFIAATALVALAAACSGTIYVAPPDGLVPLGNYGGDSAGMIVGDTATHLHVACTYGDVSGRIAVDPDGRFDVAGSYMLRAYPVTVGPAVPARFVGRLQGNRVTVTVTVDDTIEKRTVVRGPVTVKLGEDPKLGPCPICRRPVITAPRAASEPPR